MAYKRISPQPVTEGGTGVKTVTGVLIGNGTSSISGNAVTRYYTLVGGASNAISSIAPSATSGIPLISNGSSANPSSLVSSFTRLVNASSSIPRISDS